MSAVQNWVDATGLQEMLDCGWTEVDRYLATDDGRMVVRLRNHLGGETFRSLRDGAPAPQGRLW